MTKYDRMEKLLIKMRNDLMFHPYHNKFGIDRINEALKEDNTTDDLVDLYYPEDEISLVPYDLPITNTIDV